MLVDILKRNNVTVSGRGTRPLALFDHVGSGKSDLRAYDPTRYSDLGGDAQVVLDVCSALRLRDVIFLAPVVAKNPERPELAHELEESFCSTDPRIARRFAEATFLSDNRGDLPHVTVPSLIMQYSEDAIAPNEVGEYLSRHLPHSTLRVPEATGHCPHVSHPDETIRAIKEYLDDDV